MWILFQLISVALRLNMSALTNREHVSTRKRAFKVTIILAAMA